MKKLIVMIVICMVIPAISFAEDYPGPAGLTWDMNRQQVKEALSKRFKYSGQCSVENVGHRDFYSGKFAGFETDYISVTFFQDSLVGCSVKLKIAALYPVSRQYNNIKKLMREKYGEPDEAELPRKIPMLGKVMDEFEFYDTQIQSGEWDPFSAWNFDNDVRACVYITLGEVNDFGMHELELYWYFLKSGRFKRLGIESEKNKVSDF